MDRFSAVANREGPYDKLQSTIPVTDPDPSISSEFSIVFFFFITYSYCKKLIN